MNPYKDLPNYCFWSRSMTRLHPSQIDPVVRAATISRDELVGTMGSCFAQHLSNHISLSGLSYFVAEKAPAGLEMETARARGYGVFSARYGNVYTVRQALQLVQMAYNRFTPSDVAWVNGDSVVDAFRPTIEPGGFDSQQAMFRSREEHLQFVREVIEKCDWLVFTLGLTEGCISKSDGAVYPIAPGVAGGTWDPVHYEFRNFSISEVMADLFEFIDLIRKINSRLKFLLTVSPVPLIATFERRHVLVSTTYSKSVLRVACDEAERRFSDIFYFPSYELITSSANGGRYYEDDLRQVSPMGVSHVMRKFTKHFIQHTDNSTIATAPSQRVFMPHSSISEDVVCDEETIERSLRDMGF